jgi:hypothetical protein
MTVPLWAFDKIGLIRFSRRSWISRSDGHEFRATRTIWPPDGTDQSRRCRWVSMCRHIRASGWYVWLQRVSPGSRGRWTLDFGRRLFPSRLSHKRRSIARRRDEASLVCGNNQGPVVAETDVGAEEPAIQHPNPVCRRCGALTEAGKRARERPGAPSPPASRSRSRR